MNAEAKRKLKAHLEEHYLVLKQAHRAVKHELFCLVLDIKGKKRSVKEYSWTAERLLKLNEPAITGSIMDARMNAAKHMRDLQKLAIKARDLQQRVAAAKHKAHEINQLLKAVSPYKSTANQK